MLETRLAPATYKVTLDTDDGVADLDDPTGMSGDLRWCLNETIQANNNSTIQFAVPLPAGNTVIPILPQSPLPTISVPLTLDASTNAGYTPGHPVVVIDGTNAANAPPGGIAPPPGSTHGLVITGGNTVVKGLDIVDFDGDGIQLNTSGGDTVLSCYIGEDPTGQFALRNAGFGISITSSSNLIGGPSLSDGNVISGNGMDGINIGGTGSGNSVWNNTIRTDATGSFAVKNGGSGVHVFGDNNWIGDPSVIGHGNVISGNGGIGVDIAGAESAKNTVWGNYIGTGAGGLWALGNSGGVNIGVGASGNTVGEGNVISGNGTGVSIGGTGDGAGGLGSVEMTVPGPASANNAIVGNLIGTDVTGTRRIPNATGVSVVSGASFTLIDGNVISANTGDGVLVGQADHTFIQENYIGVDVGGNAALGNGWNGVELQGALTTYIVSDVICKSTGTGPNGGNGICVMPGGGQGTDGVLIVGNKIGLGADGVTPLGNANDGIYINSYLNSDVEVGMPGAVDIRNYISANDNWGVEDDTGPGVDTVVQNTSIGYDKNNNTGPPIVNQHGLHSATAPTPADNDLIQPGG